MGREKPNLNGNRNGNRPWGRRLIIIFSLATAVGQSPQNNVSSPRGKKRENPSLPTDTHGRSCLLQTGRTVNMEKGHRTQESVIELAKKRANEHT